MGVVFGPCFVIQHCVISSFAIYLTEEVRELVALHLFCTCCRVVVGLCLFLTVAWVGL